MIEKWGQNSIYSWWLQLLISKFSFSPPADTELFELLKIKNVRNNIIIYGAGKIALKYIILLQKYDVPIKGVAVSDMNNNPEQIGGVEVRSIEEYIPYKEGITILLGIGKAVREEVIMKIRRMGFDNYIVLNI